MHIPSHAGPGGQQYAEFCLAAELEKLRVEGVPFTLPDRVNGGMEKEPRVLKLGSIGFAADQLGAHELGPWTECFSARYCCRNCWWTPSCPCAHLPPGVAEQNDPPLVHSEHCHRKAAAMPPLRTAAELGLQVTTLRNCKTATARKPLYTRFGMSKQYFTLDPKCTPLTTHHPML